MRSASRADSESPRDTENNEVILGLLLAPAPQSSRLVWTLFLLHDSEDWITQRRMQEVRGIKTTAWGTPEDVT